MKHEFLFMRSKCVQRIAESKGGYIVYSTLFRQKTANVNNKHNCNSYISGLTYNNNNNNNNNNRPNTQLVTRHRPINLGLY